VLEVLGEGPPTPTVGLKEVPQGDVHALGDRLDRQLDILEPRQHRVHRSHRSSEKKEDTLFNPDYRSCTGPRKMRRFGGAARTPGRWALRRGVSACGPPRSVRGWRSVAARHAGTDRVTTP